MNVCRKEANLLLRTCRGKLMWWILILLELRTIESAASSLKAGGLICITATDTSALCGTYKNLASGSMVQNHYEIVLP